MVIELNWDRTFALEQAGDDEELLAELLELLRTSTAADLAKIETAVAAGDGKALADAAHNTKGAAASLGVASLHQVAYELEQAGRQGELELAARQLLPRLAELVAQLRQIS